MIAISFSGFVLLLSLSLVYSIPLVCSVDQLQEGDNTPYALFFSKTHFEGDQVGIRPGEAIYHGMDQKWKKSIRISPHHELIIFERKEFGGSWVVIDKSIPDFVHGVFGFEPESFWYRPKTTDPSVFPRIYAKTSFEGELLVLPFGLTELPEPKIFGSLKIPMGATVKLTVVYGPRFSTRDIVLTSDIDELIFNEPVTSVFVSIGPMEL